ncbi:TonB-dependent siderophore receptor [Leptolyngbya sp. AN03gr2]|uniref:TonB-dependent siderophore receptor n=1 Tax=unclassified Leptolyngbya TaxID=2650499 RepID=UPI003D3142B7
MIVCRSLILVGISALLTIPCIAAELDQAGQQKAPDIQPKPSLPANEETAAVSTLKDWKQPATTVQEWTAQIQAQQSTEEEADEEVVVTGEESRYRVPRSNTGTRTDTPVRDIPQSIQIVPRQVLQDRGINTVGDALENVSSVVQRDATGSIFGDLFTIRGFLIQSGITSNVFRDGLPYVIPGRLNTNDIEQVEVLKGPASILFGAGQPGGVINLVSKKPLPNPYYNAEITVGSFDTYRGAIDFSGPFDEQKRSGYRFNLSYEKFNSYRDFVSGNRLSISPVVSAALGKNTTLTVYAQLSSESETADEGIPVIGDRIPDVPRGRFLGEDFAEISSTTFNAGYTLEHKISNAWTLRQSSQYLFFEFDRYYPSLDGIDEATGDISRTAYATTGKYHRFNTSADVIGKFSTGSIEHTLLFGAEYRYGAENPAFQFSTAYDPINLFNPIYARRPYDRAFEFFRDDNFSTFALYLQDQIALLPNLKLVAGVRYDTARQFRTTQELGSDRAEFEQTDSAWSPRVGLIYQPIPAISLYASYSRSFAPAFGTRRNLDDATFEPETGRQFEVGMKADLSNRLSLTIAAYDLRKQNVETPDPGNPDFTLQTGEQTSRGIELDLVGRILPGWNVIASYAYTDAFISADNDFPVGNRLSEVPYNQASLFTTYEVQRGTLKGLGVGLGLFYVGDRQGDLSNTYVLPGYLRTDALLYYRQNNWRAQLNFRNLFNREYFVSNFSDRFVTPSAPFSVSGSLSIQF